jgi:hypothetical protein
MVDLGRGGLWTKWPRVRGYRTGPQGGSANVGEKKAQNNKNNKNNKKKKKKKKKINSLSRHLPSASALDTSPPSFGSDRSNQTTSSPQRVDGFASTDSWGTIGAGRGPYTCLGGSQRDAKAIQNRWGPLAADQLGPSQTRLLGLLAWAWTPTGVGAARRQSSLFVVGVPARPIDCPRLSPHLQALALAHTQRAGGGDHHDDDGQQRHRSKTSNNVVIEWALGASC